MTQMMDVAPQSSGAPKLVSIVVPVYWNEASLPILFGELLAQEKLLSERGCSLQLVFVDDGSGDRSLEVLLSLKSQRPDLVTVVKLARNFGAIHSSKVGINYVKGDCFLWLAADLQDPPYLVSQMVDRWLAGSKYVLAARTTRDDPASTRLSSAIYYWLVRLFVIPEYPRGGFDIILMDKSIYHYIRDSSKNINTSLLSYWLGFKPAVIEYERPAREHGQSRWTFGKRLTYFIDSILGFSIVPIRAISVVGMITAVLGFIYGTYIFVSALFGQTDAPGFATLASLLSFLLGLLIVMLGIIGEYIWRIFDEVTRRPEVVVDEVY